jgi:hypothetical protein
MARTLAQTFPEPPSSSDLTLESNLRRADSRNQISGFHRTF